ncbi:MAG: ABC transporter substrate-binding protein [Actinomycetota bacterium]
MTTPDAPNEPQTDLLAGEPTRVTRRVVLQGAGASALLMVLAACGANGENEGEGGTGGGGASAQEIDLLTVAIPATLSNLYPGQEAGNFNYYVATLVLEGLVAPDADGNLVGALAETFEQTSPTTYVYTLRENAQFSDGTPVTPDDIVYSVNLAKDPDLSPNTSYYWGNVEGAEATGEREVTITLASPDVAFAWGPCAANAMWVTKQAFVDAAGGAIGTPDALVLGTGPYKVTAFQPDTMVELERVDTWWGGSVPAKTVRFEFITEESSRLLARQSGDIDMAISISLDQAQAWEDTESTTVLFAPDRSYVGIDFNTKVEPFDDIHVRRAIAYACDRQAYVDSLLLGHGEPATALTTPDQILSVFSPEDARARLAEVLDLPFDLDKAAEELALSKVPDGFSCTVGVSNSAPQVSSMFQALSQAVAPLGIDITVEEMPVEQWYGTIGSKDWGLAYMWYFTATGDPAELSGWFLAPGNPAKYANDEMATLMDQQRAETDPAARIELLLQAQAIACQDLAYVPLWWGEAATAINDKYTIADFGSYTLLSPWTPRILTVD